VSPAATPDRDGGVSARRRIALISSSVAPEVGGVEEAVRQLALGLRSAGHEVEVWTVDRAGGSSVGTVDGLIVRYLPTPLPARSPRALARFAWVAPTAWRTWVRSYRAFRPTLVHVHCFGPNGVYALALHRRFGVPLYLTSHGETIADDGGVFGRSALLREGLRRAVGRARAVTAPSSVVIDDLVVHYGLTAGRIIPNGVDLELSGKADPTAAPYVFAAGRLGRMKGFDLLLQAFAAADLDPTVRLVIGGDGPERERLVALAASLGLASRVELRGWMTSQAVADVMAGALAVVVPSRMEAFGLVALEAWRSAAPLLMTERGGARSFVRDGVDGILIDPEDTPRFASTLARLTSDAALRASLSAAGRRRVGEFGWGAVVDRYERLYSEADANPDAVSEEAP
jgi:glycogen(starch) synthase